MGFVLTTRNCLFILIGFVFIMASCSIGIEKRRYNPGYHVSVTQKHSRKVNKAPVSGQSASHTISGNDNSRSQTVTAENDTKNRTTAVRKSVDPLAKSTSFIVEKNPDSTYKQPFFQRLTKKRLR